jgi:group II intron reverse transcriptase/maturase
MQLFAGITESMDTKLGFVAERAKRDKSATFDNLMHLINEDSLKAGYRRLAKESAVGVDGVSWEEYGQTLEANVKGLVGRIRTMSYRPQAVRRVYIPKDNGEQRPIGIPAIEDKIVQKVMSWIMEAIYEQDFHEDSYGFRRGKGCHKALKRVNDLITFGPISYVIEADIKGFFDNVKHDKLMQWLGIRITDEMFKRYIVRFLKSGYMEKDAFKKTENGTPQGGNLSPMLANVYLHYVVDEWFEGKMKPRMKGQGYVVRYCDDFVILVQYKADAELILGTLKAELWANGLKVNETKTRLINFGRFARENSQKYNRKMQTFDFLGITHYNSVSKSGKFTVGRKTSKKRLQRSLRAVGQWLKIMRNAMPLKELWEQLAVKMKGHYAYYGISDNIYGLGAYYENVRRLAHKWINRRSQKISMNWEKFKSYIERYPLPRPSIMHQFYIPPSKLCKTTC